ncbi:MAG: hypothetical protein ABJE95_37605 [Byssovorax sp.]
MANPFLERADLDEATEQRLLLENEGRGQIVAYRGFDPALPPIVLVHGFKVSASSMASLADQLVERGGEQVYLFVYDDTARYLDRCGDDLARALGDLRAKLSDPRPAIRVIAHSMGGIVARCALDSLVSPGWFPCFHGEDEAGQPLRVRGTGEDEVRGIRLEKPLADAFRRVDLITIDTPWHGFADPPMQVRAKMDVQASFVDMVSNSAVLSHLAGVALPAHFSLNQIEADNRAAGVDGDKVIGLCELPEADITRLINHFSGDAEALAHHARLQNQLRALASEEDYPALEQQLRSDAAGGRLTPARLLGLLTLAVPHLAGSHTSILENPELLPEIERTFARHT